MSPGLAEMAAGLALLDALPAGAGIPPGAATGRDTLALMLAYAGRYDEASALGRRIVAGLAGTTATGAGDRAILGNAHHALLLAHAGQGRPDEALRAANQARDAGRGGHDVLLGWAAARELRWVALPYHADDLAARRRLAVEAEGWWRHASATLAELPPRLAHLPLLLLEGDWAGARALAQAGCAPGGAVGVRAWSASALAWLARAQGDGALARRLIREELPAGPATVPGDRWFLYALPFQRLAATLALDDGDLAGARAWLAAHDRWLAWAGATLGRAEGALAWAAYYRAAAAPAAARSSAEAALAHATAPRQPLALLAAHRALGELATRAGQWRDAQEHLDSALALADACAAPYERALTLLARAELRAASGDGAGAGATLDDARALCAPLGAARALAAAAALEARLARRPDRPATGGIAPARLTPRELAVLRLIAAGRSNRAIAAALAISGRTVDRHITNLYCKIDARGKADATAYAYRHGLLAPGPAESR
jgi:DNA-binding CsgD family transcriptional regulator